MCEVYDINTGRLVITEVEYRDINPSICDMAGWAATKPTYDLTKDEEEANRINIDMNIAILIEDNERRCDNLELRLYKLEHPQG